MTTETVSNELARLRSRVAVVEADRERRQKDLDMARVAIDRAIDLLGSDPLLREAHDAVIRAGAR